MERLTKKDYCGYDIKGRENFDGYNNENDIKKLFGSLQKLGQLEDIEEELGIDLITLFKALKSKSLFHKHNFGIEQVKPLHLHYERWGIYCRINKECDCNLWLEDYGKTWALTKEELEK